MTNNQESKIVKLIIEWKWFTRGTMSRTTNQHMWYGLWLHSMDNGYFGQDHVKRPLPDNIIKPRDTLGNVSDWETTLICTWRASKIPRIYLTLCSKYLPLELEIWVFFEDTWSILCKISCKSECYTSQKLLKISFGANIQI